MESQTFIITVRSPEPISAEEMKDTVYFGHDDLEESPDVIKARTLRAFPGELKYETEEVA